MNPKDPKQVVALLVALLAAGVTAWKGPHAWSAVSAVAVLVLSTSLAILARLAQNAKVQAIEAYATDVEKELLNGATPPATLARLRAKHGRPS